MQRKYSAKCAKNEGSTWQFSLPKNLAYLLCGLINVHFKNVESQ